MSTWAEEQQPLHLVEQTVAKEDPDPKALACYGLLVRWQDPQEEPYEETWLRFVDGRPVSDLTTAFLTWSCSKLAAAGKEALLLVWDNASWHTSGAVRRWIATHNQQVKAEQASVRIIVCWLPTKSPWLNPIEPQWLHGKRRVVEPARLLTAQELAERVCTAFGCPHEEYLVLAQEVV